MRRHALGLLASGAVLLGAAALGVMGTWAAVTATAFVTVGAFLLAIVWDDATPHPIDAPVAGAHRRGPDLAA